MRAILAPSALRDIKEILLWSEEKFGKDAALRYEALLVQAVRDIEANPARPGVSHRRDIPADVSLYDLAFSRSRMAGEAVKGASAFSGFPG
jgi:plasmid stabilization system protein ParE